MPGGDEGNKAESQGWLFPLTGLLLALSIAWGIGFLQSRDAERRQQTPAAYSQAAKKDALRACAGREAGTAFECIYEKVEASQEQARAEQDLSAQQRAADSALASALIALLTLIITAMGVWFVKRTLDATWKAVEDAGEATTEMRRSNELARQSQESQLRAYVGIESLEIENFLPRTKAVFKCSVKNFGQSTARDVRYVAFAFFYRGSLSKLKFKFPHKGTSTFDIPPQGVLPIRHLWHQGAAIHADDHVLCSWGDAAVFYYGIVSYRDIFGRRRLTTFCRRTFPGYINLEGNGHLLAHPRGNRSN